MNSLKRILNLSLKVEQKESGRALLAALTAMACSWAMAAAHAQTGVQAGLDAGGLTFKDFGTADNGASFNRTDPLSTGVPSQASSRVLSVSNNERMARIRFDSIKVEVALPLGWQANEDWERGVAYSGDRNYRLIVWRVDFAFEGVKDAEHYAATKTGAIKSRRPAVETQARKLADGTFVIAYERVPPGQGDRGPRTVFDLVISKPGDPKEGVLVTLGVPASESDRGLKLLALVKEKIKIDW